MTAEHWPVPESTRGLAAVFVLAVSVACEHRWEGDYGECAPRRIDPLPRYSATDLMEGREIAVVAGDEVVYCWPEDPDPCFAGESVPDSVWVSYEDDEYGGTTCERSVDVVCSPMWLETRCCAHVRATHELDCWNEYPEE